MTMLRRSTLLRFLSLLMGLVVTQAAIVGLDARPGGASTRRAGLLVVSITSSFGGVKRTPAPKTGVVVIHRGGRQVRSLIVQAKAKRTVSLPPGTYQVSARVTGWHTAECYSVVATVAAKRVTGARPHCLLAPGIG